MENDRRFPAKELNEDKTAPKPPSKPEKFKARPLPVPPKNAAPTSANVEVSAMFKPSTTTFSPQPIQKTTAPPPKFNPKAMTGTPVQAQTTNELAPSAVSSGEPALSDDGTRLRRNTFGKLVKEPQVAKAEEPKVEQRPRLDSAFATFGKQPQPLIVRDPAPVAKPDVQATLANLDPAPKAPAPQKPETGSNTQKQQWKMAENPARRHHQ